MSNIKLVKTENSDVCQKGTLGYSMSGKKNLVKWEVRKGDIILGWIRFGMLVDAKIGKTVRWYSPVTCEGKYLQERKSNDVKKLALLYYSRNEVVVNSARLVQR